jgi:Uma2 family endonuclease
MPVTLFDEVRSGTAPPLMPITVNQFQQMIHNGILRDGDPIELIDGLLVRKDRSARGENLMGHNPRHALLIKRLQRLLVTPCETAGLHVQVQLPVKLNDINAPEPDIAVVRGTEEDYADRHPGPADLALVIEVADSSVSTDRSTKQRLYATSGVAQYWLINLPESQVEVYEQPDSTSGKYAQQTLFKPGQTLVWNLSMTQCLEINVADLCR